MAILDPAIVRDEIQAISKANLRLARLHMRHRSWSRDLVHYSCMLRSGDPEGVRDQRSDDHLSSHERMQDFAIRKDRDARLHALLGRFFEIPAIHPGRTEVVLLFRLTESGNPAVSVRIDDIQIHPRPVTGRTLAPVIARLSALMEDAGGDASLPVRHFLVGQSDSVTATSPEQAIWKWMALRHPREAQMLRATPVAEAEALCSKVAEALKGCRLYEVFPAADSLEAHAAPRRAAT